MPGGEIEDGDVDEWLCFGTIVEDAAVFELHFALILRIDTNNGLTIILLLCVLHFTCFAINKQTIVSDADNLPHIFDRKRSRSLTICSAPKG